jgi:hypothetical protein
MIYRMNYHSRKVKYSTRHKIINDLILIFWSYFLYQYIHINIMRCCLIYLYEYLRYIQNESLGEILSTKPVVIGFNK